MKLKSILLTALATISLATTIMAQVPNYLPTNGLVGWWPFNGNANDESGNGYNGTVDGAILAVDRFGGTNSAYIFDGINDYIFVSNIPDFGSYSGITISCWFKTQIYSNAGLVDRMDYVSGHRVSLRNADPIFDYDKKVWASSGNFFTNSRANSSSQYLLGQWNHVVASFSDSIRIYINATLEHTASLPNNQGNTGVLSFGRSLPDVPEYLDGLLDDIGIWNRVLSPCEIQDLYNAGLNSVVNTVTQTGPQLDADQIGALYQWLDCDNGNQPILSETNQSYTPAITGNYAVEVDMNGCVVTSACVLVDFTGLNEVNNSTINVYPNPTTESFNITLDTKLVGSNYVVYDQLGKVVQNGVINNPSQIINVAELSKGIYNMKIDNSDIHVKLIKE